MEVGIKKILTHPKIYLFGVVLFVQLSSLLAMERSEFQSTNQNLVDSLNNVSAGLIYKDSAMARIKAEEALAISTRIGYESGSANAYRHLGLLNLRAGAFAKAKEFYRLNLEFRIKEGNEISIAKAYFVLSQVTNRAGEKVETLEYLLKALDLLEKSTDTKTLNRVYDALGNHYRGERNFQLAEKYYSESLDIRLSESDSAGLLYSYQVIGNLYGVQDLNTQAKSSYREGLKYSRGDVDNRRVASISTNLGITYYKEELYDSSRFYYEEALKAQRSLGNRYSEALILNNLTALEFGLGDYRKSISYASLGVELAKETGASELLSSLYYNLSDSYKALGDYKRSFEYYKLSDSIDYEITNTEKNAQLAELQVKFDTEKKDREIAEKTLELTEASIEQKQLLAGLVILLLVAGFIYWSLLRKKKSNKLLQSKKELIEKREQEKALLLRELHHRVKNNFQVVSSLLNLQYYEAESHTAAEAIKAGQTRVEAMSMIHRKLYQGENDTALEMKDYVVHLIENAIYLYDFEPEAVDLDLDIDDSPLDVKYAIPLGIIINELITNAFKHAFQAVARPALRVYLNMDTASQKLTLTVGDNGPGLPHTGEVKASSFGLELIGDLMKQLKGKMTTDNQSGAEFTIVFPYIPLSAHVEG